MEILAVLVALLLCVVTALYIKLLNVEASNKQAASSSAQKAEPNTEKVVAEASEKKALKKQKQPVKQDDVSESDDEDAQELVNRLAELEGRLSSFDNIMTAQGDRIKSLQTDLKEADGNLAQEKQRNSLLQGQLKELATRSDDVRAVPQTNLSANLVGAESMSMDNMSTPPMSPVNCAPSLPASPGLMDMHNMNPLLFNMYLNSLNDATPSINSAQKDAAVAAAAATYNMTQMGAMTPARAMSPVSGISMSPPSRSVSFRWNAASPTGSVSSTSSYASLARRYKKILCRNWVRNNGSCHYGASCTFAHGDTELVQEKGVTRMARKASNASIISSLSASSTAWDNLDVSDVRDFVPSPGLLSSKGMGMDDIEEEESRGVELLC
jgi:hypothetical protein